MAHNPRHPYDEANDIVNQYLPAQANANRIVRDAFPAAAAADRLMAEAGLIPKRGRGGLTVGTGGGVGPGRYTGPRTSLGGPGSRATWSGPHRRAPSVVGGLIRKDTSGTVDINRWSARMQAHGIPLDWILDAYETAGGSADLSAEQRAGNTQDFLGDFVEALVDLGADPDVLLVSYQEAGGRIGKGPGGPGGGRSNAGPGGFLGGAARVGQDVVGAVTKAGGDVADEIGRAIKKVF